MKSAREKAEEIILKMKDPMSKSSKDISFYKPKTYTSRQKTMLSKDAISSYIESITIYNIMCEILGLSYLKIDREDM